MDVRELVVDLSHAGPLPSALLDLMRRVETNVVAHNGTFELAGLTPPVLHVSADRHRSFVDIGAPGRGAWWRA